MGNTFRRILVLLAMAALFAPTARAQQAADLMPLLQAELTEIRVLTAQYRDLLQRGNTVTAATIASYIPDHYLQSQRLISAIEARGGDPSRVQAVAAQPFTGDRLAVVRHDLQAHERVISDYRALRERATDPEIQRIATLGLSGASRHHNSLLVAQASFTGTREDMLRGAVAALTLERAAIADLQTQAARLNELNDPATANIMLAMVPQRQAQAQRWEGVITEMGGNPAQAVPPPTVPLPTRNEILLNARYFDTQLVNTYALPMETLPRDNPFRVAATQGQQIAFAGFMQWLQVPVTV